MKILTAILALSLASCATSPDGGSPKAHIFTGVTPIIGIEFLGVVVGMGYVGRPDAKTDPFPSAVK